MRWRAYLLRNVATGEDPYGGDPPADWQEQADPIPCYFWWSSRDEDSDPERNILMSRYRMMVPTRADITEHDRIRIILDRRGNEVHCQYPLEVKGIRPRQDHQLVNLESYSYPAKAGDTPPEEEDE